MTDLTAITTPFGLLDAKTQAALKAHGGPWEFAAPENDWKWLPVEFARPLWSRQNVYRVKPQPPKPREWWIYYDFGEEARLSDVKPACNWDVCIHVREVLE